MADAMEQPTSRVMATREDDAWLADVPELPGAHTFARTLPALDKAVREVIVLAADLPDDVMGHLTLTWDYRYRGRDGGSPGCSDRHFRSTW